MEQKIASWKINARRLICKRIVNRFAGPDDFFEVMLNLDLFLQIDVLRLQTVLQLLNLVKRFAERFFCMFSFGDITGIYINVTGIGNRWK